MKTGKHRDQTVQGSVHAPGGRRLPSMRTVLAVVLSLLVVAVLYDLVGTDRAVTACSADPPGRATSLTAASREVGWSFSPPGFVCEYTDANGKILNLTHLGLWP